MQILNGRSSHVTSQVLTEPGVAPSFVPGSPFSTSRSSPNDRMGTTFGGFCASLSLSLLENLRYVEGLELFLNVGRIHFEQVTTSDSRPSNSGPSIEWSTKRRRCFPSTTKCSGLRLPWQREALILPRPPTCIYVFSSVCSMHKDSLARRWILCFSFKNTWASEDDLRRDKRGTTFILHDVITASATHRLCFSAANQIRISRDV